MLNLQSSATTAPKVRKQNSLFLFTFRIWNIYAESQYCLDKISGQFLNNMWLANENFILFHWPWAVIRSASVEEFQVLF